MKNERAGLIYDISIIILATISVIFAVIDITSTLPYWCAVLDNIIYGIFIVDYITRLIISKDKVKFIKSNILDLIALIPFNSLFRALRVLKIARLTKIAKLSKLTRVASRSGRGLHKIQRFLDTNGFKYMVLFSVASVLLASFAIMFVENMDFIDALWWSFVTATTVGYGDISPSTDLGKLIAAILMLVGIGMIGSLTSTITSFFLSSNSKKVDDSKIEMCLLLYEQLDDEEKEIFKENIK